MSKQILTSGDFWRAVRDLKLEEANELYVCQVKDYTMEEYDMCIWEVSDEDFKKLCEISDDDWQKLWGWWRSSDGTIIGERLLRTIQIADKEIVAWYDKLELDEYISDLLEPGETAEELEKQFFEEMKYENLYRYCCDALHLSNMKNFLAVSTDLAQLNNMTLSELFKKYM